MSAILSTVALLGSLAATVKAHGYVDGIVAGGQYHQGYDISYSYQTNPPVVVGWTEKNQDNGYVSDYTSPDIICHKSATPAGTHAEIKGGDSLEFQWNTWPDSHHGPVITYLAKCQDKCEDADKTALKWFKIDEAGQIDSSSVPGTWASDKLIANNNSYTVTIPDSIASGNYVARHEIIALHSAGQEGGAQNYPYCVNLAVTSSGSDEPEGVLGTALYTATDPGITVNIYGPLKYQIPGPALYSGASSGSGSAAASPSAAASSAPAATSAAAASSSAPVTTQAAVVSTSSAAAAAVTSDVTDVAYATTAVTVTGSAPAATATAPASGSSSGSSAAPSKALPEGTTLQDLLSWVTELFDAKSSSSKAKRAHARDIRM